MPGGLSLTREAGETVVLDTSDGPVCVTVHHFRDGKVRLIFDAPQSVRIMRGELHRGGGKRFDEEFRTR